MVQSTSSEVVIPSVDRVFSLFGYSEVVKSDNGPPFNGTKWAEYMKECDVKHRKITPLWPQVNVQAEGFNKPLMKAIKIAHQKGQKWLPIPKSISFYATCDHNIHSTPIAVR